MWMWLKHGFHAYPWSQLEILLLNHSKEYMTTFETCFGTHCMWVHTLPLGGCLLLASTSRIHVCRLAVLDPWYPKSIYIKLYISISKYYTKIKEIISKRKKKFIWWFYTLYIPEKHMNMYAYLYVYILVPKIKK